MAFKIHKVDDGHNLPFEYLPAAAITPEAGMALTVSSGKLAAATATTAPTYICMVEKDAAVEAGSVIPVVRVGKEVIWETEAAADMAAVAIGSKVTIDSTGMAVTATTASGVAEVVAKDGDAAGSKIYVRF